MWTVEPITKKQADYIVTRRHYSRRAPSFVCAFALVDGDGLIEGVVAYGNGPATIRRGAIGDLGVDVYELTRLVIQTTKPNAASFLVGRSLRQLRAPSLVVSYADTEWGHAGIVYQATNWLYTGEVVGRDNTYIIDGKPVHQMTLHRQGVRKKVAWAKENGVEIVRTSNKHRYFYLNGTPRQKKEMCSTLRYSVVDQYPKSEKRMYDAGEHVLLSVHDRDADMFGGLC